MKILDECNDPIRFWKLREWVTARVPFPVAGLMAARGCAANGC